MWKSGERASKRRRKEEKGEEQKKEEEEKEEEQEQEEERDEEALDALFNETVRYLVVNSYVSVITEFYAW